jgi:DNA-binding GntR family transcriptional regulator
MKMEPPRIRVRTAEDQVYEGLREQILGGLEPGLALRPAAIAPRFGVSPMPVRAALVRLENEGLVRILPRRGTVVAPLEPDDLQEIVATRRGLEGLAARIGAINAGSETVHTMAEALNRLEVAADTVDLEAYLDAEHEIEDALFGAAHRPRLLRLVRHFRRAAERYVRAAMLIEPVLDSAWHASLIASTAAGDGEKAARLVESRADRTLEFVSLRLWPDDPVA